MKQAKIYNFKSQEKFIECAKIAIVTFYEYKDEHIFFLFAYETDALLSTNISYIFTNVYVNDFGKREILAPLNTKYYTIVEKNRYSNI